MGCLCSHFSIAQHLRSQSNAPDCPSQLLRVSALSTLLPANVQPLRPRRCPSCGRREPSAS